MIDELEILLSGKEKKILFVGVGNILRSDDGVGVYISERIKERRNLKVLTAEVSIENYIGKINTLGPDILIITDCLDSNILPGSVRLLNMNQVQDLTFHTHTVSLSRLKDFFSMDVYILGIQPEKIDFGEKISELVLHVADSIIEQINKEEVNHGCTVSLQSMQGSSESKDIDHSCRGEA